MTKEDLEKYAIGQEIQSRIKSKQNSIDIIHQVAGDNPGNAGVTVYGCRGGGAKDELIACGERDLQQSIARLIIDYRKNEIQVLEKQFREL